MDDSRPAFLDAHGVMARYGWRKTKGYHNLKDPKAGSALAKTHPDRWRLDVMAGDE